MNTTDEPTLFQDLQFAVSAAGLGTFYCEWPFDKIIWNETCKQHFFLPPDTDVDFNLFYSLLHPDDRERTREAIDRAIEEQTEYNVEYRASAPEGGNIRWINAIGRAQYDPSGIPIRFDGVTMDITARKQAELDLAEALRRETLINRIGQAIRIAQDPDAVLAAAVEALGQALDADRCYYVTYDLAQGRGTLGPDWHRAGLESIAGDYDFRTFNFNQDPAYLSGRTHVVEDSLALPGDAPPARIGLRSLMRAPLAPGRMMTALAVAMADTPRRWTPNEIRLVEAIASQTQAALEATRLRQRDHRIATALQDALQPPVPDDIPRLRVAAYTRPALDEAAIGGDFFDVFALDKELYALVIGDVSGKGLAAAAQLAAVRNMLRGVLFQYRDAAEAVTSLNTVMTAHDLLAGFVTLFVGLYDAHTGQITFASCGHEPGLVHRGGLGLVERLMPTGPPVGISESVDYEARTVTLLAGDLLFLYTDGLSEAGPTRLELLGTEGLTRLLVSQADQLDVQRGAMQIVSDAHAYAQGVFRDDVCVLLLRRQGGDNFYERQLS